MLGYILAATAAALSGAGPPPENAVVWQTYAQDDCGGPSTDVTIPLGTCFPTAVGSMMLRDTGGSVDKFGWGSVEFVSYLTPDCHGMAARAIPFKSNVCISADAHGESSYKLTAYGSAPPVPSPPTVLPVPHVPGPGFGMLKHTLCLQPNCTGTCESYLLPLGTCINVPGLHMSFAVQQGTDSVSTYQYRGFLGPNCEVWSRTTVIVAFEQGCDKRLVFGGKSSEVSIAAAAPQLNLATYECQGTDVCTTPACLLRLEYTLSCLVGPGETSKRVVCAADNTAEITHYSDSTCSLAVRSESLPPDTCMPSNGRLVSYACEKDTGDRRHGVQRTPTPLTPSPGTLSPPEPAPTEATSRAFSETRIAVLVVLAVLAAAC